MKELYAFEIFWQYNISHETGLKQNAEQFKYSIQFCNFFMIRTSLGDAKSFQTIQWNTFAHGQAKNTHDFAIWVPSGFKRDILLRLRSHGVGSIDVCI